MPTPTPTSITVAVLRILRDWSQRELAEAAGVRPSTISDYERGKKSPSPQMLERLNSVMGFPPSQVERTLAFINAARSSLAGTATAPDLDAIVDEEGRFYADFLRASVGRVLARTCTLEARRRARDLWARLRRYSTGERRALVKESEEFRTWALCELLCEESAKTAADSSEGARDLAELALFVAESLPESEGRLRFSAQGYAWAFIGNARRVKGDLPGADEAFTRSHKLWHAGAAPATEGLFDEARLLDLEASLRREQRRLSEALKLLDQALSMVSSGAARGRILIIKAKTLEEQGEHAEALAMLQRAAVLVEERKEPRLRLCLRFNVVVNLCGLERYGESELLLPEVRELTSLLGNDLDGLRLRWLEAKIAAGLGRVQEAEEGFRRVRAEFTCREIPYDAALVSLELAVLLAEQRRSRDVKDLVRQMAPLFQAQGVHREAFAAFDLFRKAAEAEMVTVELASQVLRYLHRSRHDSQARFVPGS